ncbi:MAG: hypothetical protein UX53_C0033G0013 [Candidatus Azambacteria bacterium GW2011_GWB2_46_37]|uniref:Uncharacterized protein n=1 Tax=Candidatus Azambacteria bacterium GW2011_GWB2_46_37 TaxID=1618618 RepID=A0A0G1SYI1_9BACT|nr:MAG: hypothetical protein UX53_C0033G0013 [Candidatus Azambacteria bacterium GW2011_GWB2_46_37]
MTAFVSATRSKFSFSNRAVVSTRERIKRSLISADMSFPRLRISSKTSFCLPPSLMSSSRLQRIDVRGFLSWWPKIEISSSRNFSCCSCSCFLRAVMFGSMPMKNLTLPCSSNTGDILISCQVSTPSFLLLRTSPANGCFLFLIVSHIFS